MPEFYELLGVCIWLLVCFGLIPLCWCIGSLCDELTRYFILKRNPNFVFLTFNGFIYKLKEKIKRKKKNEN